MSTKENVEISLMLGGAALGLVGAILVEPAVIGVGVIAAGTVAVMRFKDQRSALQSAKRLSDGVAAPIK
jgi:hypothetical protein